MELSIDVELGDVMDGTPDDVVMHEVVRYLGSLSEHEWVKLLDTVEGNYFINWHRVGELLCVDQGDRQAWPDAISAVNALAKGWLGFEPDDSHTA